MNRYVIGSVLDTTQPLGTPSGATQSRSEFSAQTSTGRGGTSSDKPIETDVGQQLIPTASGSTCSQDRIADAEIRSIHALLRPAALSRSGGLE